MNENELLNRISELKAEYLSVYPQLSEDNFVEAAENVGNADYTDEEWLDAYACHIEDVADRYYSIPPTFGS